MYGDQAVCVRYTTRPGSFIGLMSLYESNYIRLGWIIRDFALLRRSGEQRVSRVDADCPLHLSVDEVTPYTSTLTLTYQFDDDVAEPDLRVRVYHDARVAEVLALSEPKQHAPLQGIAGMLRDMHAKWRRNVMLNKWLEYCADRGHAFGCAEIAPVADE